MPSAAPCPHTPPVFFFHDDPVDPSPVPLTSDDTPSAPTPNPDAPTRKIVMPTPSVNYLLLPPERNPDGYLTANDLRQNAVKQYAKLHLSSPAAPDVQVQAPDTPAVSLPEGVIDEVQPVKPAVNIKKSPTPTPLMCQEIINEWESIPEDDVSCLSERWTLNEDQSLMPEGFPVELWKYVEDVQKPLVAGRWSRFSKERLAGILHTIAQPKAYKICEERPKQKPYLVAQLYANLHAIFHIDEEFPARISGYTMRILTTTEEPQAIRKQQIFSSLQQLFLNAKSQQLLRRGYCQVSESNYRSRLVLVEYVERVRAFMDKFGSDAHNAMRQPEYADLVCQFYRVTGDLRMLNSVTVPDMQPMPRLIDVLDSFGRDSHFSAFDLQDGFWCILLHIDDRHKTAFATHNMLLEWTVNPQGSKNGAVVFARVIRISCETGHLASKSTKMTSFHTASPSSLSSTVNNTCLMPCPPAMSLASSRRCNSTSRASSA